MSAGDPALRDAEASSRARRGRPGPPGRGGEFSGSAPATVREGDWATGAGLTAQRCADFVSRVCPHVEVHRLPERALWGREITDECDLLVGHPFRAA